MDHMAVGMDVDVAAGLEGRKFCQQCGTGNWWSRTDCRHCASVGSDDADIPQSSTQEKFAVLEKTLAGMGDDEPILAGKKVLEKELEKLQKKLNGPKKTAKHIKAKQNWTNRESKRLEAETARLTELQESLRVRKETLKVAYEEVKILREDLLREGETMDKNKSHFLSPEDTEEIRSLEQQELAFWRGSTSKRLACWTRDCSSEEIETQQRSRSKEEKTARDDREGIKERCQNGGRCHGWFGWFSVVTRVQTRILQAMFECKQHEKEKEFGTVECCDRSGFLESVELECGWFGRRHFPVADFNACRLGCVVVARMFQKIGWSERWCSRIVHAIRTPGRIAMSGGYRQSEMERIIEDCRECGKMDCGRAGWTADPHFSTLASQRKKTGKIRGCFDGDSRILEWETQTCDLGWRLQCEPIRHDRLSPCGRVDPETKNVGRHKRFIAIESFTHDGDRTGFDGDKHVDEFSHRTRAFHAIQLVKPRRLVDTKWTSS